MRKAKEPKEPKLAKDSGAKSRAEKEPKAPVEEPAPPAIESEAVRARRESRAEGFKALGDPIRLAICEYLSACEPSEQTAGTVCRAVTGDKKITAKVSHHLKELRRANLIAMRKNGKNVLCALDASGTQALTTYLSSWTANGAEDTDSIKTSSEKNEKASKGNDSDSTNNDNEFLDANSDAGLRLANAA